MTTAPNKSKSQFMKWDKVGDVEEIVWFLRTNDLTRGANREKINRLFNGGLPYSKAQEAENSVSVNRNFLTGPNILTSGRGQWNNAFLKQKTYFGVSLDSGPVNKRQEAGAIITRNINRQLKKCRAQMEQIRAEGAQVILHGIAPSGFKDRRCPILTSLPVASLLIPDETDLDFENLEYFAVFREWTPYQLYALTHGPKVDPGWNMEAVQAEWDYVKEQTRKELPGSNTLQFMPERIMELEKQAALWGTTAVPTVDVWDFYFREAEDGQGWYRRIMLDWGAAEGGLNANSAQPESRNGAGEKDYGGFLYTSGQRKYANSLSEILQCQFGDCSAVAPFKYHSVRSLGWLLWGVCEIENRLRCRFTENMFMNMMWWFKCASGGDMARVKKAMFEQIGVIPAGITMMTENERFKPDEKLWAVMVEQIEKTMNQSAGSFMGNPADIGKEETATGTMARVHSVGQMMGGMLTLAYEYSKYKYQEQSRRFCIKNSPYQMVKDFRLACLKDGLDAEMLDSSRWNIEPDRALGDGNKILEMAIAQGLENIRKNATPDGQRLIDHQYVVTLTDRPDLAEALFPLQGQKKLSPSSHDAQLAADRILRGLQFAIPSEAVPEDYVMVWLGDMAAVIKQIQGTGNVGTMPELLGLANLGQHIGQAIGLMASGHGKEPGHGQKRGEAEDMHKIKQYKDALGKMMNLVKGFAQRLQEQQQKGNGHGLDPEKMANIQTDQMKVKAKIQLGQESHAAKTAQRQAAFELEQRRKDRESEAETRRQNQRTGQEIAHKHLDKLLDAHHRMLGEGDERTQQD